MTRNTGAIGEVLAARHLEKAGYSIITTNWHCRYGEIDIIAQKDDTLVFVEVRTRRTQTTESAFASITPSKREKLIKSANLYLQANNIDCAWRIDVIGVALRHGGKPRIEHVEDALDW